MIAVPTILAADALPWAVGIAGVSIVALGLIIVAPWRTVRREPPLADEIESRLLLGEDPEDIERDLATGDVGRAPVTDLHAAPEPEADASD